MLRLDTAQWLQLRALAYAALPEEMCALLAGDPGAGAANSAVVRWIYPCRNAAASAKVYTVDPRDHLRADRDADHRGWEIIGVVHSHTHTPAHPSPTDIAQAPDPTWRYPILSLADDQPSLRSWRIVDGNIAEEAVVVEKG